MNIEVTKEQYKKILQAFYLGDLVLHSMKDENEENDESYIATEQYLFSLAKDFGYEDYVLFDKDLDQYFPTPLMENEFDTAMLKYEQEIFPDQLAATLARNKVEAMLDAKEISTDEAGLLLLELEDKYLDQLDQDGLNRIDIK
ncbi:hypothetical protein [Jeotgalibacillus marinus]|uniref:DUF4375 domain-containing protein n=1 Tax=Jeotgalibacillus marinus TaxID=86667 RepID=A0ABV3Q3Q6_9BACL